MKKLNANNMTFYKDFLKSARKAQQKAKLKLGRLTAFTSRLYGDGNSWEIFSSDVRGRVATVKAANAYDARAKYIFAKIKGDGWHDVTFIDSTTGNPLVHTEDLPRYRAGVGIKNTAIIHDTTIAGWPHIASVVWRGKTNWKTCTEAQVEADEKVKTFNAE